MLKSRPCWRKYFLSPTQLTGSCAVHEAHRAQSLSISFGADISASGKLIPLTPATYLEFPNNIGPNCGYWTFATGAEDPRLYWSEDMRPMLSYIMPNPGEGYCRGPALWEDLRLAWPALGEALRNVKAIPSTKGRTLESSNIAYQKASST
jgi:hypothetical protein